MQGFVEFDDFVARVTGFLQPTTAGEAASQAASGPPPAISVATAATTTLSETEAAAAASSRAASRMDSVDLAVFRTRLAVPLRPRVESSLAAPGPARRSAGATVR